jgi:hypothetical protein
MLPSPLGGLESGGRNPTVGSAGGEPVEGSIDVKDHVATPVEVSSFALIRRTTLVVGRKSKLIA